MCHGFGCGFNVEVYLAVIDGRSGKKQAIVGAWTRL